MNKIQISAFISALKKTKGDTYGKRKHIAENTNSGVVTNEPISPSSLEQNKPRQHKIAVKKRVD